MKEHFEVSETDKCIANGIIAIAYVSSDGLGAWRLIVKVVEISVEVESDESCVVLKASARARLSVGIAIGLGNDKKSMRVYEIAVRFAGG